MVTFRNNNGRRNNFRRNDRNFKSNGDKILSENYFQHADHFTRILGDQEKLKRLKSSNNIVSNVENSNGDEKKNEELSGDDLDNSNKISTKVV